MLEGKVGEGREAAEILRKELGTLKSLRETESQEDAARIAELEARALESQARHLKELDALREGLLKEKSEQRKSRLSYGSVELRTRFSLLYFKILKS